ncbi:MAG TPA: hypothetical protein VLB73_01440 [Patescibacteria group bacterium]|nr:hypothetical protein [Patescibacteria group bacterium]
MTTWQEEFMRRHAEAAGKAAEDFRGATPGLARRGALLDVLNQAERARNAMVETIRTVREVVTGRVQP